jgi:hypothetical protein
VEIPESHRFLEKNGITILRNIVVYDYYWRLYRNLDIRNPEDLAAYVTGRPHPILSGMINFQRKFSVRVLKTGVFSKILMFISYVKSLGNRISSGS